MDSIIIECAKSSYIKYVVIGLFTLISAILAALFSYFLTKKLRKSASRSDDIKSLICTIEKFESLCLTYWSNDSTDNDATLNESLIKSSFTRIRIQVENGCFNLTKSEKDKLNTSISKLYDEATGGEFECKNRKASNVKASKIVILTSSIMPILIKKTFY